MDNPNDQSVVAASQQQPPQPQPQQPQQQQPRAQGGSGKLWMAVGAVIVVIIIVAAAVMLLTPSSNPVYSLLSNLSRSPSNVQYERALAMAISSHMNSTSQYTLNYSGSVKVSGGMLSTLMGNTTISMPVSISLEKYNNNSRADIKLSGVPMLGSLWASAIKLNGVNYTCVGPLSVMGESTNGTCTESRPGGTSLSLSSAMSENMLAMVANSLQDAKVTQTSVDGQQCALFSATMDMNLSALSNQMASLGTSELGSLEPSGSSAANEWLNGPFSVCLSESSYAPLSLYLNMSLKNQTGTELTLSMNLTATEVSSSASPNFVNTLPWTVQNTSAFGSYPTGSSGSSGLQNACIASQGFMCESPLLSSSNGQIDFEVGQNTGATYGNVTLACAAMTNMTTGLPYVAANTSAIENAVLNFYASSPNYPGFHPLPSSGSVYGATYPGTNLSSGEMTGVGMLPCYNYTGHMLGATPSGTQFSGYIWMGYNSSGKSGPDDSIAKVATVSLSSCEGSCTS